MEKIYEAVRDGTFGRESGETLTLRQLGDRCTSRATSAPRADGRSDRNERYRWNVMIDTKRIHGRRRLATTSCPELRKHHVEAFVDANHVERIVTITGRQGPHTTRRNAGASSRPTVASAAQGVLQLGSSIGSTSKESPAQRVRKRREFERERRLEPGEERIWLRALTKDDWLWRLRIVAALETGCRIGEILNVQFKQLRWDLNELHLSNRTTKDCARGTCRCRRSSGDARTPAARSDGEEFTPDAYVFGNEVGERLKNYQKAVVDASGSARSATGRTGAPNGSVPPRCREQLRGK